jgi:hypothetical protein
MMMDKPKSSTLRMPPLEAGLNALGPDAAKLIEENATRAAPMSTLQKLDDIQFRLQKIEIELRSKGFRV